MSGHADCLILIGSYRCLSCVRMLSALSTVLSEGRGEKSMQTPHPAHTLPYT